MIVGMETGTALIEDFDRVAATARQVLVGVGHEQYGLPTPCPEWDVRAVVNHVVTSNLFFVSIVRGDRPPDRSADHLGDDPAAAFDGSIAGLRELFTTPGTLERTYPSPLGEQPGSFLVHLRITEMLTHSWDVAKATGQPTDLEPDIAARVLLTWRERMGSGPRPDGIPFGPAQPAPPGTSPADRLAAFLGRQLDLP